MKRGAVLLAMLALAAPAQAAGPAPTLLKDINPSGDSWAFSFAVLGNTAFFVADDGVHGEELWKTDGTAAGTTLVKDIVAGPASGFPRSLVSHGGALYLVADDVTHGAELWRSDGTTDGTVRVTDINAGGGDGVTGLSVAGGALYFGANDGASGRELYHSDGTAAGTARVKDINPGPASSGPDGFVGWGGHVYFAAEDGSSGYELWRTDGTEAGTALFKNINAGSGNGSNSNPGNFTAFDGRLWFTADNESNSNYELWTTDGTEAGTRLEIALNPAGNGAGGPLLAHDGKLYFSGNDGVTGHELWRTDGALAGTTLVKDINPDTGSSFIRQLVAADGGLYFSATEPAHGEELWFSDGTPTGTALFADLLEGPEDGEPDGLTPFGDTMLFTADGGTHGNELWRLGPEPVPPKATTTVTTSEAPVVPAAIAPAWPTPPSGPVGVSINDGARYTNDAEVEVSMVWPLGSTVALVANDGGFRQGRSFALKPTIEWKLDSSGPERLPKTIYVRFGDSTQTFQDDIVLDETAPKVKLREGADDRLRITASDRASGVAAVQVTDDKREPGRRLAYRGRPLKRSIGDADRLFVRAIDRAGNRSRWTAFDAG